MSKTINVNKIDLEDLDSLYEKDFKPVEKKDRAIHMKFTTEYRHREKTKLKKQFCH